MFGRKVESLDAHRLHALGGGGWYLAREVDVRRSARLESLHDRVGRLATGLGDRCHDPGRIGNHRLRCTNCAGLFRERKAIPVTVEDRATRCGGDNLNAMLTRRTRGVPIAVDHLQLHGPSKADHEK